MEECTFVVKPFTSLWWTNSLQEDFEKVISDAEFCMQLKGEISKENQTLRVVYETISDILDCEERTTDTDIYHVMDLLEQMKPYPNLWYYMEILLTHMPYKLRKEYDFVSLYCSM